MGTIGIIKPKYKNMFPKVHLKMYKAEKKVLGVKILSLHSILFFLEHILFS